MQKNSTKLSVLVGYPQKENGVLQNYHCTSFFSLLPSSALHSLTRLRRRRPGFPLALPFSQTYPLCCIDIRSFTEQYYQFSEGFAEHHRDIDDVLRKVRPSLPFLHSPLINAR